MIELRLAAAGHTRKLLCVTGSDRYHDPATDLQLIEQRGRHIGATGCDDDRAERGMLRPAERAVTAADLDVVITKFREPLLRDVSKLGVALDREDAGGDRRVHSRCVARARPDLEDSIVRLELRRLGHECDDVGLRNCLAGLNRKRPVVVREFGKLGRQEILARNRGHSCQYQWICNPTGTDVTVHHELMLA